MANWEKTGRCVECMDNFSLSILLQAPKGSNLDKTSVMYELVLQPPMNKGEAGYQKEYSLRRLEKMQFPTKDEQFKRRLLAGGARDVTSSKDKERSKDSDRSC